TVQISASAVSAQSQALLVDFLWSTNDPSIATVDTTGLVTGVGSGTATITATIAGNGLTQFVQASSQVTVTCPGNCGGGGGTGGGTGGGGTGGGGTGGGGTVATFGGQSVGPKDPNDKAGSQGVGPQRYISGLIPLRYAVFFGNEATASAAAQKVVVTDQINTANIDLTTLLGAAGIAGIAVALGAQTLIKDWLAGFFLLAENQMAVDDYVAAAGVEGLVVAVGLRTSRLRDARGRIVIVPNGQITALTNYSRGGLGSVEIGIPLKEIEVAALVRDVRLCAVEEGLHDVSVQLGKVENGYGWVVVQFQYIRPTPDAMSLIRLTLVAALQKRGWRLSPP
ncbi:MAG: mechanosensitive ion channel, partial [bacterium]|nr:mechanosensitive ion channel [bacterium]